MGLVSAGVLAAWLVLRLLTREPDRAGLVTAILAALLFSFSWCGTAVDGALDYLGNFWVKRDHHVPAALLLALLAIAVALTDRMIIRRLTNPSTWTRWLNTFALILVALPTGAATYAAVREPAQPVLQASAGGIPTVAGTSGTPDIYYIILDAYARSDVMKELFGFDNEPFLERLERKGFFIARESTTNYCQTKLSLCSSLNFDYLDTMIDAASHDTTPLTDLIGDNRLINSLRPLGYRFVAYSTGYDPTNHPKADIYLNPSDPTSSSFHQLLLGMTPLAFLLPKVEVIDSRASCRERTLYILDHLAEIARTKGPTFTFAHIVSPHPPFVFGENGEDVGFRRRAAKPDDNRRHPGRTDMTEIYRDGYRKQAIFLTRRIEQTIDRILEDSPEPPIIILQSDHGSGLRHHLDDLEKSDLHERLSILNCYYFPDGKYDGLSNQITPVSSFREVLTHFFGARLPRLAERNYFSPYADPLSLVDVTERLRSGKDRGRLYSPPAFYHFVEE
jgi:hypothetical protein